MTDVPRGEDHGWGHPRAPILLPDGPNQRWSLDFLSDAFVDGRRFRILAVVDDFTRECLRRTSSGWKILQKRTVG